MLNNFQNETKLREFIIVTNRARAVAMFRAGTSVSVRQDTQDLTTQAATTSTNVPRELQFAQRKPFATEVQI